MPNSDVLTSRAEAGNSPDPFQVFADGSDAGLVAPILHRECSAASAPSLGFMESCPLTVRLDCRQSPKKSLFVRLQ